VPEALCDDRVVPTQLTVCALLACQAAKGRRVRVYWPDDDAWFTGTVRRFDPRSGLHTVCYDDGDREQLMLAVERFEWLGEGAGAAPFRVPPTSRLVSASLAAAPSRGARTLVRKEQTGAYESQDAEWPRVGDLVWGHVKARPICPLLLSHDMRAHRLPPPQGHGWWPGRVADDSFERPANLAKGTVAVSFFDNTSGWLPRHGCLPFVENFEALHSRKAKLPAFLAASRVCPPRSCGSAALF
jgi:hypothetical protein